MLAVTALVLSILALVVAAITADALRRHKAQFSFSAPEVERLKQQAINQPVPTGALDSDGLPVRPPVEGPQKMPLDMEHPYDDPDYLGALPELVEPPEDVEVGHVRVWQDPEPGDDIAPPAGEAPSATAFLRNVADEMLGADVSPSREAEAIARLEGDVPEVDEDDLPVVDPAAVAEMTAEREADALNRLTPEGLDEPDDRDLPVVKPRAVEADNPENV